METSEIFPPIKMLVFDIKNNDLAKMNLLAMIFWSENQIKSQIREGGKGGNIHRRNKMFVIEEKSIHK